jgi:ribosomal protein S18 acetylase RimI-like enzyme
MDFGPMAALGFRFVRNICYEMLLADGVLRLALYEVDDEPAGFVAYTARSVGFHRVALRKHWPRVVWGLITAIASDPRRALRLVRALRVVGSRRTHLAHERDPLGEVLCLAVRRRFLGSRFVRQTGVKVSEELELHALKRLRETGVPRVRMFVDTDNRAALVLHHRLGARFERSELGGAPQLLVWFDLEADPEAAPKQERPGPFE